MKSRSQNEFDIKQLFGTDGPVANELILRLINEFDLAAFTDEAVNRLAELHRAREEQETEASLRRHRR